MHLCIYLYPASCTTSFPAVHGFFCFVCFCLCLFSPLQNGCHHHRHHCQCHHHRFARISDSFVRISDSLCKNWSRIMRRWKRGDHCLDAKFALLRDWTILSETGHDGSGDRKRDWGVQSFEEPAGDFGVGTVPPPPPHTHTLSHRHTHSHTHTQPRFRSLWSLVSSPHEYSCGMVHDTQMCTCSHPFQNVVMWNSSLETNTLLTVMSWMFACSAHRFPARKDVVNGQCLEFGMFAEYTQCERTGAIMFPVLGFRGWYTTCAKTQSSQLDKWLKQKVPKWWWHSPTDA